MNGDKKEVVLISASPRATDESTSEWFASVLEGKMKSEDIHVTRVDVRKSLMRNSTEADFAAMLRADAQVFLFPLYIYCLPGMLMRFLQDYHQYYLNHREAARAAKLYAVVNCGFPEADINGEAVRVIESFAKKAGNTFRFGVLVGGGPMIFGGKNAPFMKKVLAELESALVQIGEDVQDARRPVQNISVSVESPRKLYFFFAGMGWVTSARKNGLKKRDLYRRPYL